MDGKKQLRHITVGEIVDQMTPNGLQHFEIECDRDHGNGGRRIQVRLWDRSIVRHHYLQLDSVWPGQASQVRILQEKASYLQRELTGTLGKLSELKCERAEQENHQPEPVAKVA